MRSTSLDYLDLSLISATGSEVGRYNLTNVYGIIAIADQQYPLSSRTLAPSHDPQYYTRIKDGVHRSAEGKGRSWWKSFFQLKGEA